MSYLHLDGLVKRFDDFLAVDDLSLEVEKGEFVALLGPSGCGKTTTLRMIAGFYPVDAGHIRVEDERIDHLPSRQRGAAMVFQDYALFPHMTAYENVAFGLKMAKVPKTEIRERVQDALALVHLPAVGEQYPKELSGGMKQRVALARAIVLNPKLLLLDEPLSNLDAKLRKQLRVELRDIHDRAGITTVFVTHDLEEAFSLADRVAVMSAGKLQQYGTPVDIYTKPATEFVADFVGHTNIIHGSWTPTSNGVGRFTGEGLTILTKFNPSEATRGVLTVPPHHIKVTTQRDATLGPNTFEGKVRFRSYLGSSVMLIVNVGDIDLHCEAQANRDLVDLGVGDSVWVTWDPRDGTYVSG